MVKQLEKEREEDLEKKMHAEDAAKKANREKAAQELQDWFTESRGLDSFYRFGIKVLATPSLMFH